MPTFIVDCPYCKAKVAAEETGSAEDAGFDDEVGEPYGWRLYVGKCPRCNTPLAAQSRQLRFAGWEGDSEDFWSDPVRVHPKPPKTFSSFRIPNSVTASLTEADIALQGNASLAACVMFGRALEALCRDVLYTAEEKKAVRVGTSKKRMMLAEGIKQLREKNFIDNRLFDWSQHLHAFRNLAAHSDSDATITREDAEDLQAFVYAIIEPTATRNSRSGKRDEPKRKQNQKPRRQSGEMIHSTPSGRTKTTQKLSQKRSQIVKKT
jgi:hypothetical protein